MKFYQEYIIVVLWNCCPVSDTKGGDDVTEVILVTKEIPHSYLINTPMNGSRPFNGHFNSGRHLARKTTTNHLL